jgi:thiol-disulfide isomerase/thioredoxin
MRNKIIFGLVALCLFIASGVAGYYGPSWLRERRAEEANAAFKPAVVPKKQTDEFSRQFTNFLMAKEPMRLPDVPIQDMAGKRRKIEEFYGRPLLVNFWATWCAPCVVELPSLEKFRKRYEGRIDVMGVVLEETKTPEKVKEFLKRRGIGDFAGYLDDSGRFIRKLAIRGIPTSFLIGSDGQILYIFEGDADWTSPETTAFFDVFLLQNR